ncbi:hypothetical protein JT063_05815, partial [Helicobacter pylori]|nr:hypothetical protein [Helicobacter pylori]
EMKFFEVNQIVWIFSCFLLSKIAYNQRKAKNRLTHRLQAKKRLKRKYEQNHSQKKWLERYQQKNRHGKV